MTLDICFWSSQLWPHLWLTIQFAMHNDLVMDVNAFLLYPLLWMSFSNPTLVSLGNRLKGEDPRPGRPGAHAFQRSPTKILARLAVEVGAGLGRRSTESCSRHEVLTGGVTWDGAYPWRQSANQHSLTFHDTEAHLPERHWGDTPGLMERGTKHISICLT